MKKKKRVVYSSDLGKICPDCRRPEKYCICRERAKEAKPKKTDGIVRVGRSTKGRKGAGVTVVTGLPLSEKDLKALAKKLKAKCGSGGTIKDGVIEIQGEHRDKLVGELEKLGYTVKKSGG